MNESPSVNFGRYIVHTKAHKIIPGCLRMLGAGKLHNNHLLEKNTITIKSDTEINIEKCMF